MTKFKVAAIAAAISLFTTASQAAVLFQDTFSADDRGTGSYTTVTELTNWNIVRGNVDILDEDGIYACPSTCIDLDGTGSPGPVIMQSKTLFNFSAGNEYKLTVDFPRGTQNDSLIFGINIPGVGVTSESAVGYTFPSTYEMMFNSGTDFSAYLYIEMLVVPNNLGPYLDTVTLEGPLTAVPLPASGLLLIAGLGLFATRRRGHN